jgi:hypothetical protein
MPWPPSSPRKHRRRRDARPPGCERGPRADHRRGRSGEEDAVPQFPSKADLILAFLEARGQRWTADWLLAEILELAAAPRDRSLALFDALDEWFHSDDYESDAFTCALLEIRGKADPVHQEAAHQLEVIREMLQDHAQQVGVDDPEAVAYQMQILMRRDRIRYPWGSRRRPTRPRARQAAPRKRALTSRAEPSQHASSSRCRETLVSGRGRYSALSQPADAGHADVGRRCRAWCRAQTRWAQEDLLSTRRTTERWSWLRDQNCAERTHGAGEHSTVELDAPGVSQAADFLQAAEQQRRPRRPRCRNRTESATLTVRPRNLVEPLAHPLAIALIAPSRACIAADWRVGAASAGGSGSPKLASPGCRGPHDRFRNPGSTPRTIAMSPYVQVVCERAVVAQD